MSGFTDYHAHFVYGVDDGAQTREEMYAMLDAAAADGVRHLFATSHSTPGMERFPQEIYDRHLAFARDYCAQKGYDLKLEHGSELLYTPAAGYAAVQRQLLTLGDTGWVLLEFVPNITAKELETALQEIDPGPRCDGVSDRVENRVPAEENPGRDTGERRVGECVAEK